MIIWHGILQIKNNKREEYLNEIISHSLIDKFRTHPGNVFYQIGMSYTDPNALIICDGWDNIENFRKHDSSSDVDIWRSIYKKYVINCSSYLTETLE